MSRERRRFRDAAIRRNPIAQDYRDERRIAYQLIEQASERMMGERHPWVLLEAVREVLRRAEVQANLSPDAHDDVQYVMASLRSLAEVLWRDDVIIGRGRKPF